LLVKPVIDDLEKPAFSAVMFTGALAYYHFNPLISAAISVFTITVLLFLLRPEAGGGYEAGCTYSAEKFMIIASFVMI
jgi:hypothetical protein